MDNNENQTEFRWIDESIDISDIYPRLPKITKDVIRDAEQADLEDNYPMYYFLIEDIEIQTKLLVPDVISHHEWDLICWKYCP